MKRVILSLLAATAMTAAASAADLPRRAQPAYIAPVFTWTGFYAGLNAGYAFNGDSDLKNVNYNYGPFVGNYGNNFFNNRKTTDEGSFTGGGTVGYNYQMGSFVLGLEADINYANVEKKYYASYVTASGYTFDELNAKSRTEWFGTVRPRLGFTPVDRLMVFVTGGLAYGQVKTSGEYVDHFNGYSFGGNKSDTRVGWTVGAGAEYAITNNIIIKGEYAYVDLGEKNRLVPGFYNTESFTWKDATNFHVVRAGVNYKF